MESESDLILKGIWLVRVEQSQRGRSFICLWVSVWCATHCPCALLSLWHSWSSFLHLSSQKSTESMHTIDLHISLVICVMHTEAHSLRRSWLPALWAVQTTPRALAALFALLSDTALFAFSKHYSIFEGTLSQVPVSFFDLWGETKVWTELVVCSRALCIGFWVFGVSFFQNSGVFFFVLLFAKKKE